MTFLVIIKTTHPNLIFVKFVSEVEPQTGDIILYFYTLKQHFYFKRTLKINKHRF